MKTPDGLWPRYCPLCLADCGDEEGLAEHMIDDHPGLQIVIEHDTGTVEKIPPDND